MDKAIFQFDTSAYDKDVVEGFSREECEKLSNIDEENVVKFDFNNTSLQSIMNDDVFITFDLDNCWFRVFLTEND